MKDSSSREIKASYAQEDVGGKKAKNLENLMFRRTLIREPMKEEASQRKSMFRVKCKVQKKVCEVIIDSCSIDNIALEELVD